MKPEEVADLLRYASTLDRWLRASDQESGQMMVAGWSNMLAAVPATAAQATVLAHYSQANARTLTPGDILSAWRDQELRETRTVADKEARTPRTGGQLLGVYLRRVLEVVRGGGRVEDVPVPSGSGLTPAAEAWARRCAYPTICACSHTECRAGWLDVETSVVNGLGDTYPAVRRCPVCADGLLMAEEKGIARKPSKYSGARR